MERSDWTNKAMMIFLIKVCPFFQNLGHVNCDSYQMPLESSPAYYLTKKSWFRIGKIVTNSYNIHSPTHTQKSRSLLVLSTTPNIKRPITISNKASRSVVSRPWCHLRQMIDFPPLKRGWRPTSVPRWWSLCSASDASANLSSFFFSDKRHVGLKLLTTY